MVRGFLFFLKDAQVITDDDTLLNVPRLLRVLDSHDDQKVSTPSLGVFGASEFGRWTQPKGGLGFTRLKSRVYL